MAQDLSNPEIIETTDRTVVLTFKICGVQEKSLRQEERIVIFIYNTVDVAHILMMISLHQPIPVSDISEVWKAERWYKQILANRT